MSGRGLLDADMATIGRAAGDALRWWRDELAAMVPPRWRDRAAAPRALADYRPATGDIVVRHDDSSRGGGTAPTAVVLPAGVLLTRVLERPAMSQRNLDSMLALESDRILPLAAGEAVLATRIVARDDVHRRLTVDVAALPLAAAQRLGVALAALPRPVHAVYTATPEPGAPPPINLLPALRRAGIVADTAASADRLWLAVAFLFALNIGVLIWRDVAVVDTLADIVAEQQPAVDTAHRIDARIDQVDRFVAATRARRGDTAPLALLGTIARALPPGVWLQRFGAQGDGLRLTGYRPAGADVSAALRRAGFSVTRYSETAATGQSRLGQAFEATLRRRKP